MVGIRNLEKVSAFSLIFVWFHGRLKDTERHVGAFLTQLSKS